MKLGDGLQRKRGKNNHTCPILNNDFLASSNQMKLCTIDYIFPIKQDDICDYSPLCFMSSGLMLDDIIINILTESAKKSTTPHQKHFFPDSRMIQFTFRKYQCNILYGTGTIPILKGHYIVSFYWNLNIEKYLSDILFIENDTM